MRMKRERPVPCLFPRETSRSQELLFAAAGLNPASDLLAAVGTVLILASISMLRYISLRMLAEALSTTQFWGKGRSRFQ